MLFSNFLSFPIFYGRTPFVRHCTGISPCHAGWIICHRLSPISTWWSCHQFALVVSFYLRPTKRIVSCQLCWTVLLFSFASAKLKSEMGFILLYFLSLMISLLSYVGFLTLFLVGTLVIYLGLLKIRLIWLHLVSVLFRQWRFALVLQNSFAK